MANRLYEILPTVQLNEGAQYCHPPTQPEVAHIDDPALSVMTDFVHNNPVTITPDDYIPNALTEMKSHQVHSLLVIGSDKQVLGLITSEDMLGEKPLQIIQERQVPRNEIKVRALTTPINKLLLLDYNIISHTKVGNVIHTLTELHHHYALVTEFDKENHTHMIRGIFSARKISEQLGIIVRDEITEAHSIAELQSKLKSLK